jgi:Dyp-type peroxidase family
MSEEEPELDALDIQGNVLPGFRRNEQMFVAFSAPDRQRLSVALRALAPLVTSMATALSHRQERKLAFAAGQKARTRPDVWLAVALGANALESLGASDIVGLDDAFPIGPLASRTGDPTQATLPDGSPNPGHRSHWVVGARNEPVDLLLIFAHDTDVSRAAASTLAQVSDVLGVAPVYKEVARLLSGDIEHFGFRDGISQPGVRGNVKIEGVLVPITTRYGVPPRDGVEYGKPGQPLLGPGQFLTGMPGSPEAGAGLPREFANGSFLVFRRLTQDVKAFYEDTDAMAAELSSRSGHALSGADLRARIVGRFPSGAALMRHDSEPLTVDSPFALNHFEYARPLGALRLTDPSGTLVSASFADPHPVLGHRCPVWAHVRKMNPRDLGTDKGGPGETRSFQMLRRGIPFGRLYDHGNPDAPTNAAERGLLFVSYQRHIAGQFEVLNSDWMNSFHGPQSGGYDLLVGQKVPTDSGYHAPKEAEYHHPASGGVAVPFTTPRQWVIVTGGAYLFAPSLSFLARFSALPQV